MSSGLRSVGSGQSGRAPLCSRRWAACRCQPARAAYSGVQPSARGRSGSPFPSGGGPPYHWNGKLLSGINTAVDRRVLF